MALKTAGTNGTTSLNGFIVGQNDVIPADVATLNNALKFDPIVENGAPVGTYQTVMNQGYQQTGLLHVPKRGLLKLYPGDWVLWDTTTGFPFVLPAYTLTNGPYTHT